MPAKKSTKTKAKRTKAAKSPQPQGEKTGQPKAAKADAPQKPKKLSALGAAAKVLAESKEPMTTRQMIDVMGAKGYWQSPAGQTPQATLYSAILRQIKLKGTDARFKKTERGKFALAK